MKNQIEIHRGLPPQYKHEAAALYYETFQQKFAPALAPPTSGAAVLAASFQAEQAIVALHGDQLAGVAGLEHDNRHFIDPQISTFTGEYGLLRGLYRLTIFLLLSLSDKPHPDMVLLESLTVCPTMRGQGVGTKLLAAVYDYTREKGFAAVCLKVVDTNPRARQLYERQGFKATTTQHYPYLRWLGFTAVTTMVKDV